MCIRDRYRPPGDRCGNHFGTNARKPLLHRENVGTQPEHFTGLSLRGAMATIRRKRRNRLATIAPQHRRIPRPPEYGPIGNCHPDYHCAGIPLSHRTGNDNQFPSTAEYFTTVSLGIRKRTMERNIRLCTEPRFQVSQLRRQFAITSISQFHRVQTQ